MNYENLQKFRIFLLQRCTELTAEAQIAESNNQIDEMGKITQRIKELNDIMAKWNELDKSTGCQHENIKIKAFGIECKDCGKDIEK